LKRLILTADDFGLCESVNEAVERAHRDGLLTSASLMVAGPAVEDAVRRARRMPDLRVGLHLVVIEGPAVLPRSAIPGLVDANGWFPSDQLKLPVRYFFLPRVRVQLAAEIRAQFEAFVATGLALDHADAHKHMQLHPTVGRMLLSIGREFGLRAVRVPAEPPSVLAACGTRPTLDARWMSGWASRYRYQARDAGMATNDAVFGVAWSGHMTEDKLLRLVEHLPDGVSECYLHPGAWRDATLAKYMPDYEHQAELRSLLSPRLREALERHGIERTNYTAVAGTE
jgi:hopanoid biosynthesis associated protein HpnK